MSSNQKSLLVGLGAVFLVYFLIFAAVYGDNDRISRDKFCSPLYETDTLGGSALMLTSYPSRLVICGLTYKYR